MIALAEERGGSVVYVLLVTLVAALGGLLFGYDTAVISGAIGYLKDHFALNSYWEGFAAACALAGCAGGAGLAGFLSDRFGRKKVLILAALAFFVSALGTAVPRTLTTFIIFRFLGGLGIGAASITSPMYIAEITPFRIRGRMVSLNQFAIVSGILIVYFVNYFIVSHGLAVDRKTIQVQEATGGKYLDATKVRKYLEDRVGEMVNRQIEQFLVQPRAKLDRRAVVEFLHWQGLDVEPQEIAAADGPQKPARVREILEKELPEANRLRIYEFVSGQYLTLESPQVADFLGKYDIQATPIEVRLAIDDLTSWNVRWGWRWMFASGVFPSVVFFVLLLAVPESPRWLIKHERRGEALAILTRVDGQHFAQMELRTIDESIAAESGRLSELWEPWMRGVLFVGVALAVLQQVTGINVFLYFAPKIFQGLGAGADTAMLQTVIVGAVNLAFTVLAVAVVDRVGRRPLMIIGAIGMGVALTALGLAAYWQWFHWWSLVFILGYIACFAMSVGPVTWVILSEIFPTKIRGRAMGLATICLWLANYAVSQTFPMMDADPGLLARYHHGFPFWVYAAFCLVLFVVVWRWVPETKGKSLEEIERDWLRRK